MVAGFPPPSGVEVGSFSYTLAFSRLTSVLSRCQILAWLVSWGRWLGPGLVSYAWLRHDQPGRASSFLRPSLRSAGGVGLHS